MRVDQFDFVLPKDRIATQPANPRDAAKLLHVGETLKEYHIRDLPQLLHAGDILIFNDSKVIPARLFTAVDGKQVEVLLHRRQQDGTWTAFARPARKLKEGMQLSFAEDFAAEVVGRTEDGQVRLRFADGEQLLFRKLHQYGHVPLPPYIERPDTRQDIRDYQTIYARHEGSVAAPTAGLHFTPELLTHLSHRGIETAFVTLHVGAGTFQPVKVEDTDEHVMHAEWAEISHEAAEAINDAKFNGGKVVAVGTTSLRILETVADTYGNLHAFSGETDIFITPGYEFKLVDRLLTNFHLPKSTLFMLVSAFAGLPRMKEAYDYAIQHDYRFYSYGDACLLDRAA